MTKSDDKNWRRNDAAKRSETINALVEAGRKAGHPMTFAERVAAAYAEAAEGKKLR